MSRKKDISREEIAKQFLLPERQSKIDTLLKQDGQAYCICRSSDSSRFMIACDACEEWYHGDCMNISEREAKLIKQYVCVRCTEEDPTLQTRWKSKRDETGTSATTTNTTTNTDDGCQPQQKRNATGTTKKQRGGGGGGAGTAASGAGGKKLKKCGDCMGCYRTEDCGKCEVCTDRGRSKKDRCMQRICINYGGCFYSGGRRRRRDSNGDQDAANYDAHLKTEHPRQCYGPTCTRAARYGSKYCSDNCGLQLATNRILQVLPPRLQEWALTPCVAEEKNIRALDVIRTQQNEVKRILTELDRRHREIDALVERAAKSTCDPRLDRSAQDDDETSMYCITCGHEIHSRSAIKHMEKCFNKYESQASFGSIFKTRIEGNNMFCDFYNPLNRTYCKRLRVLCPEHCKDPKIDEDEVCGCPLVVNVFDISGEFCRAQKKVCLRHYMWEKMKRAEIDLERVRQWLKMDELLEKERQVRSSMANRAGVLALMLHSTYNHEVIEKFRKASQHEQQAMQKEQQQKSGQTPLPPSSSSSQN